MAATKGKKFITVIYVLTGSALLIITAVSTFQTLKVGVSRFFNDLFYPYLSVPAAAKNLLADKSLLMHNKYTLAARLESLQKQNGVLAAKAAVAAELTVENEMLRKMLKMRPPREYRYIYTEVLLRDPLFWNENFSLSKGSEDGVVPGAAVLAVDPANGKPALAGIVSSVSKHSCRALTLLSPGMRISTYLPHSGAFGFINGPEQGRHRLNRAGIGFLPVNKHYYSEEKVVTTGFETNIPPGVTIGELDSLDTGGTVFRNKLYLAGTLKPAAEFNGIRFVIIAVNNSITTGKPKP